ncbi:MAG: hypothetical protein ACREXN_04955 [Polaromonas sp.]
MKHRNHPPIALPAEQPAAKRRGPKPVAATITHAATIQAAVDA